MARTVVTPTKSTAYRPVRIGRTDVFYQFRKGEQQNLDAFLDEFLVKWREVKDLGVTELNGLVQLVQVLPAEWQGWASVAALDYIDYGMDIMEIGNLFEFIDVIRERYRSGQCPPPGVYPPLEEFLPAVHDVLTVVTFVNEAINPEYDTEESVENSEWDEPEDTDLSPGESSDLDPAIASPMELEPEDGSSSPNLDPIVSDPQMDLLDANPIDLDPAVLTPEDPDMEADVFSIDLDLYDQPFALDPDPLQALPASPTPEPPLETLPAVQKAEPSRPSGIARHFKYEPEFQPSVGTASLQPLSFDQMPFVTDPSLLAPEHRYSFTRPFDKFVTPELEYDEKIEDPETADNGSDGNTTWSDF